MCEILTPKGKIMNTGMRANVGQPGKGSDVQRHKIRAAVLRKRGGPLEIETIEMEGPREDEVLVRMVASGICHTV